ncbi:flagellar biosynthetic protein FliQ [Yoonia maritima]|uniref:flagellar biosynthetic protein FliQ n=1 Tax=Yoonia maritima TaxID=1435347 RepID=UPI000D0F2FAB|nr:flagellar biosynthetic protein FliQ [Yoonia maritima]
MEDTTYVGHLVAFMLDAAIIAGIPLAVATVVGLVISIFQAVTQIQDQTLAQTAKIVSIAFVLLTFGGYLVSPLMTHTANLFGDLASVGR